MSESLYVFWQIVSAGFAVGLTAAFVHIMYCVMDSNFQVI